VSATDEETSRAIHPSRGSAAEEELLARWNEAGAIFGMPPDTLEEMRRYGQ